MSITQRSDSIISYFDGYINASTTLNQFFKLYEKALEIRNEKEIKADHDCINSLPVLKTPSPMEKQTSELYTRKLFTRFQEELVSTLTFMASKVDDEGEVTTYRVSKFGEDNKGHCVGFNVVDMRVSCSCHMFEFSGLVCSHVLTVFRVTNVLKLLFHYILKHWTRNAKSSVILGSHGTDLFNSYLESHTVRYYMLSHEALKLVDEGAGSLDSYNEAMASLDEATEKVVSATKSDGKFSNGHIKGESVSNGAHVNHCTDDHKGCSAEHLPKEDFDRRISELTQELECANKKCEVDHTHLLTVLKEIEEHKQQLSVQVNDIKLSMMDDF
ncbi:hypothetical protein LIER_03705 [Lithospermum erythrorhizon]|uniref:Protein FAR1-RELATED SEQUENCE n=1 Tax=Lithospermum erythrorhizon TaxID=34254 RepID=A0AAV3NYS1_LITER